MSKSISRRNFLKSSVAAAAGLAIASPFRAATAEDSNAVSYCDTIAWNAAYDVVVIGFGGAGACASIEAAENGAKVLLIDKAPLGHEGGNTRYCAQQILDYEDYEGGLAYTKKSFEYFDHLSDAHAEFIVTEMMKNFDWLAERGLNTNCQVQHAVEYPEIESSNYPLWKKLVDESDITGQTYWNAVRKAVLDRADKIDVWLSSPAKHLIQNPVSKTVIGVQIERNGELLNVRAKNGVVLSCGGFENNDDMVENYLHRTSCQPLGTAYNTGDGVTMGAEVGAQLWHMSALSGPWISAHVPGDDQRITWDGMLECLIPGEACIHVGIDGRRFMKESGMHRHGHVPYGGWYTNQITLPKMWAIFDESARTSGNLMLTGYAKDMSDMLESGKLVKADTLAELEEKLGIQREIYKITDPSNPLQQYFSNEYMETGLEATVKRYNAYCANGFDEQFERDPATLKAFSDVGPYYGFELFAGMVNTQGGPKRNTNCEVLDLNDQPIPHLYSAGELGSFWGGLYTGGGNIAETIFTGRISGRMAAQPKEDDAPIVFVKAESNLMDYGSDINEGEEDTTALAENQYIGKADGIGGTMRVLVSFEDQKISEVVVLSHQETFGIGTDPIQNMPEKFIGMSTVEEVESADVFSGATVTSKAIKQAVIDCINQANK